MISVSNEFRALMAERTDFTCHADVTLADGSEMSWGPADFVLSGNTLTDGAGTEDFPLGAAICRTVLLCVMNDDGHLDDCDFFGAQIRLSLDFRLSETVERIALGTFTVTEPETMGQTVTITAGDAMYRADRPYQTALTFPATLETMFRDVCDRCGIPYSTAVFPNGTFSVQAAPKEGYTCRQVLGYIAMIAGGNARISRDGRMEILTYDLGREPDHELTDWVSLKTDTDDILITGLETVTADEDDEENTVLEGAEGYVLTVDNPLIAGKEAQALSLMGRGIIGRAFRKFDGAYIAYPLAEFMDTVRLTDRKGNTYTSVITDVEFVFGGRTTLSNSAASAVRNSSRYISPEVKARIAARELVERERTARETAIGHLNELLAGAGGMFSTEQRQPDGSTVHYLHNKPTLGESTNVMKLTAEAIGFSMDGGKTYPFGFAISGEMIMGVIRSEGISADWIDTGALVVKDAMGKVIFMADVAGHRFIVDTENFKVAEDGTVTATNGAFSGTLKATGTVYSESGTIAAEMQADYSNILSGAGYKVHVDRFDGPSFNSKNENDLFRLYPIFRRHISTVPGNKDSANTVAPVMELYRMDESGAFKKMITIDGDSGSIEATSINAPRISGELAGNATTASGIYNNRLYDDLTGTRFTAAATGGAKTSLAAGDANHGVYSDTHSKWIAHLNGDGVPYVGGTRMTEIQRGVASITPEANAVTSLSVTFTTSFSGTPRVIVTPASASNAVQFVGASDISASGFTLYLYRANTTATNISWVALY